MPAIVSGAIPETLSPQVQTVLNFLTLLGAGDIDKLSNLLSDDLSYYVHPKSLNIPCLAKHEWLERVKKGFVGMKFYIFEIVCEGPSVAVHASSTATSRTGGSYANEYSFWFHLEQQPEGTHRMKTVKEFLDSKYIIEFKTEETERAEKLAK